MSRASALQHKPQTERGFTLVELMAVLAVLSILLLVAMTAYQDYAVRSQVSEGIRIAASHKSGVAQTFYTTGTLPGTNAAARIMAPTMPNKIAR